ncbi:MAG TPA: hypothetical protein VFI57_04540 [Pyrinomonadaceae bacterium]|nr:hypothetical protein [Pyrinomonadaceae bacterium]
MVNVVLGFALRKVLRRLRARSPLLKVRSIAAVEGALDRRR